MTFKEVKNEVQKSIIPGVVTSLMAVLVVFAIDWFVSSFVTKESFNELKASNENAHLRYSMFQNQVSTQLTEIKTRQDTILFMLIEQKEGKQ